MSQREYMRYQVMKIIVLFSIFLSFHAHSFLMTDRSQPDPQNQVVLGFSSQNPASPLQFPCLLIKGRLECDPDLIRMESSVCLRTLHYKKNINSQYTVSCNISLSQELILAMSYPGEMHGNGYLRLQLNPRLKLENVMKPRKSGFGYFQINFE